MFIEVKKTTYQTHRARHSAMFQKGGRLVFMKNMSEILGNAVGLRCGLLVGIGDQAGNLAIRIGTGDWKVARNGPNGFAIGASDLKRYFAEGTRFTFEDKADDMIVLKATAGTTNETNPG